MHRQIRAILIALIGAAALGCQESAPPEEARDVSPDVERSAPAALTRVDYAAWEALRRTFMPDIVVVDLWASWCVPCLERFPHMVELHRKYADRGVQFVSLSLDDRDSPSDLEFAEAFLAKQNAPFPHYLLDEDILEGFDKIGLRGVPAVDVFGRDGELVVRLTGDDPRDQFDDDDVEQAIVMLLGERR